MLPGVGWPIVVGSHPLEDTWKSLETYLIVTTGDGWHGASRVVEVTKHPQGTGLNL